MAEAQPRDPSAVVQAGEDAHARSADSEPLPTRAVATGRPGDPLRSSRSSAITPLALLTLLLVLTVLALAV
jgi:hypothetical protein